jgi:hypothetical protein
VFRGEKQINLYKIVTDALKKCEARCYTGLGRLVLIQCSGFVVGHTIVSSHLGATLGDIDGVRKEWFHDVEAAGLPLHSLAMQRSCHVSPS